MNRNLRESLVGRRNISSSLSHHRRAQTFTGYSKDSDENLDLFSKSRRSLSVASSDESSDVSVKLGRLSVGSAKLARIGIDDLLSSTDGGKHDYDWLLTPPGTPLFPSSDCNESQPTPAAPRSLTLVRSVSTTKASRLSVSVSQSESNHSSRPSRSSSVTRPSLSTSQYSTYSSSKSSSILNTSSASVSSYIRPSSPNIRSTSTARPSTPSSRPTLSRPSTPSRVRPVSASTSIDRTRPSQNSRPSTPSCRAQIPANLNPAASRSNSRPSTPTRRNPAPSPSGTPTSTASSARVMLNGRSPGSQPSSPSPRVRPLQQPIVPPDFPLETPPNLRTTLPDRPVSTGRSRPSATVPTKGSAETTGLSNVPRRHSSPIVARGRLNEPLGKGRINTSGLVADGSESRKASHLSDLATHKSIKTSPTASDSTGFGRTISKKSLDMAIRHMDIRNGSASTRTLSSTTLFPQSIRSTISKIQSARAWNASDSINSNGSLHGGGILENGNNISRHTENGCETHKGRYSAKLNEVDMYESSRYDALLLKEDLKNTNWLHSIDDKSDQGLIFDNGFESLPEPFDLL